MSAFGTAMTRIAAARARFIIGATLVVAVTVLGLPVTATKADASTPGCKISGMPVIRTPSQVGNSMTIESPDGSCVVDFLFNSFGVWNSWPRSPRISPDGRFIAWVGTVGQYQDALFWATIDAKYGGRVAETNAAPLPPAPNPRGDMIDSLAFTSDSLHLVFSMMPATTDAYYAQHDIYSIGLDGGDLAQVTSTSNDEINVDVVGNKMVVSQSDQYAKYQIVAMGTDGQNSHPLTCTGGGDPNCVDALNSFPRISPDGTRIVFQSTRGSGGCCVNFAVYSVAFEGGALTALSAILEGNHFPMWAPGGAYVVYNGNYPNPGATQYCGQMFFEPCRFDAVFAVRASGGQAPMLIGDRNQIVGVGPLNLPADLVQKIGACARNQCPRGGDPVSLASGNVVLDNVDLAIATGGPALSFTRAHNNQDATSGPFGKGWRSNFDEAVTENMPGSLPTTTTGQTWIRSDGRRDFYKFISASGTYQPGDGRHDELEKLGDHFVGTLTSGEIHTFDASGHLVSVTDKFNKGYTIARDETKRPTIVTSTFGPTMTIAYLPDGHLSTATTSDGRSTRYQYQGDQLLTATMPGSQVWSYTYDALANLATVTNPAGIQIYSNDLADGYVGAQTSPRGAKSSFTYFGDTNSAGTGSTVISDAVGATTTDTWDSAGNATGHTDAEGNTTVFTNSPEGDRTRVVDPNGGTTSMSYSDGDLATRTRPTGGTTTTSWRDDHQPTVSTDPTNVATTFGYNDNGSLTSLKSGAAAGNTLIGYNPDGSVASVTSPDGLAMTLGYDGSGRNNSMTAPGGRTTTTLYNPDGTIASTTSPGVGTTPAVTTNTYDASGRIATSTSPNGSVVTTTYNGASDVATKTDESGQVTSFGYDEAHNLVRTATGTGASTIAADFTYDANDRLATMTNQGASSPTTISYSPAGRIAASTDPDGAETTFSYRASGQLESETYADGTSATYSYNADGAMAHKATNRGGSADFSYDAGGKVTVANTAEGRLKNLSYDPSGRGTGAIDFNVTDPSGPAHPYRVAHVLSGGGRTNSTTYERGHIAGPITDPVFMPDESSSIDYNYATSDGSLESVTSPELIGPGASITDSYFAESGRLATKTTPATTTAYEYDLAGQMTGSTTNVGTQSFSYPTTYDARGLVTSSGAVTYSYDARGQMISAHDPETNENWTYSYDGRGNRTSATSSSGYSQNLAYSSGDRITSPGFAYDSAGRLISDTTSSGEKRHYLWNGFGQLSGVDLYDPTTGHSRSVRYVYDAFGKVVERSEYIDLTYQASKVAYHFDGDRLISEADLTGTIREYLYVGADQAPASMRSRQADGSYKNYFFVTNTHGDVVALTDKDGNVVNAYAYGPWGEATHVSEQVHQPFRYAGYYFDDATGAYWLDARWYEPESGRFVSKDKANPDLRDLISLNPYVYGANSPGTHTDPSGMSPIKPRGGGPWKPPVGPRAVAPKPLKPPAPLRSGPETISGGEAGACMSQAWEAANHLILSRLPYVGVVYSLLTSSSGWDKAAAVAITVGAIALGAMAAAAAATTAGAVLAFSGVGLAVGLFEGAAAYAGYQSGSSCRGPANMQPPGQGEVGVSPTVRSLADEINASS